MRPSSLSFVAISNQSSPTTCGITEGHGDCNSQNLKMQFESTCHCESGFPPHCENKIRYTREDFPGSSVVKNPPANRGIWLLVQEGPTCLGVTKSEHHSYQSALKGPGIIATEPVHLELLLSNKRDGMGREVGGGFGMGNTCKYMVDSCQCMAKTTTIS